MSDCILQCETMFIVKRSNFIWNSIFCCHEILLWSVKLKLKLILKFTKMHKSNWHWCWSSRWKLSWIRRKCNYNIASLVCSDWFRLIRELGRMRWYIWHMGCSILSHRHLQKYSSVPFEWSLKSWWNCMKSSHLNWCDSINLECSKSTCIQLDNYSQTAR